MSVVKETSSHIEVGTTVFRQRSDGSILPESITGYIEPSKSSGIKIEKITRPALAAARSLRARDQGPNSRILPGGDGL